jgi:hypothetical protein
VGVGVWGIERENDFRFSDNVYMTLHLQIFRFQNYVLSVEHHNSVLYVTQCIQIQ